MTEEAGHRRADPGAVAALWREHRRWVAAVLVAHAPRHADLEDLLQDVALTLVSRVHELREPRALRGWLRTVALNTARMAARRRPLRALEDEPGLPDPAGEREGRRLAAAEEAEHVLGQVRQLPEAYREPLLLKCVRGLSQRQIAGLLQVPETTVETRLARARRMLRERLAGVEDSRRADDTGSGRNAAS
jgi:RNA polymerase sigma-70 factor (ECF subfamily)